VNFSDRQHQRHEHIESRVHPKLHVRITGRAGETHRPKAEKGTPVRPLQLHPNPPRVPLPGVRPRCWRPAAWSAPRWHHTSKRRSLPTLSAKAIATCGGQVRGVVFHTDRGTWSVHVGGHSPLSKAYGIRQSVGRTGVCWDNAAAESFVGTLKKELVNRADYHNRHQARRSIRYWIEAWYNPRRLHSTIGHQPPNECADN